MSRKLAAEVLSLLWTALLILFLRWVVVEPFKIPSGSMIPTLLVGDFIFVAKSSYDLRIPFTNHTFLRIDDPRRGDVIVFEYPNHEQDPLKDGEYFIKRLIGLPGDRVELKRGYPIVNGAPPAVNGVFDEQAIARIDGFRFNPNDRLFFEKLPDTKAPHWVQRYPYRGGGDAVPDGTEPPCVPLTNPSEATTSDRPYSRLELNEICEFQVPPDHYFFMGDNRDDSSDSRSWGFVPRKLLKGRALFTWFTCESIDSGRLSGDLGHCLSAIRWSRLGKSIR